MMLNAGEDFLSKQSRFTDILTVLVKVASVSSDVPGFNDDSFLKGEVIGKGSEELSVEEYLSLVSISLIVVNGGFPVMSGFNVLWAPVVVCSFTELLLVRRCVLLSGVCKF